MKNLFRAKKTLGFDDRWMMVFGIPLVTLALNALMFTEIMMENPAVFFQGCFPVGLAYTILYWISFRSLFVLLKKKFFGPERFIQRMVVQTVLVILLSFALKTVLDPLLHPHISDYVDTGGTHGVSMTISALIITFLVLGVYEIGGFYTQVQQERLEKERLIRANTQSQLASLRSQVSPHFFFNSLNTLMYLISENPRRAEAFVQKLSKAYRYILDIRGRELVTLEEELNFLRAYTGLLQERFGQNLEIAVEVPDRLLACRVVPLCLQMLFENAIKHNEVSAEKPLRIEVAADGEEFLVVRNVLQLKKQAMPSTKVGLENIRRRYQLVSDRQMEVLSAGEWFVVVLPLLPKSAALADIG